MEYEQALAEARRRHPLPFAPGSADELAALQRFRRFFADFAPDRVQRLLAETYAPQLYFNDTLKTLHDRDALARYLEDSAAAVASCAVAVRDAISNREGDYYLRWHMRIRFRKFARGRDTASIGISQLRLDGDGRVTFHQDFWNAADGVYEHMPLLGSLIRRVKRRL